MASSCNHHDDISSDGHDDHSCSSSDNNNNDDNNNDDIIKHAANVINKADYLLILAGAGFSSDSGLSTYETMGPIKYQELCNPIHLTASSSNDNENNTQKTTKEFQQFWIDFAIKYKNCQPHYGYTILNNWLGGNGDNDDDDDGDNNGSGDGGVVVVVGGSGDSVDYDDSDHNDHQTLSTTRLPHIKDWYVYTSNVDGHFRRYDKFQNNKICEIHGYAGEFRCSNSIGYEHDYSSTGRQQRKPRHGLIWSKWNEHVASKNCSKKCNTTTIDISSTTSSSVDGTASSSTNNDSDDDKLLLRYCQYCGLVMRPNVLMFHDTDMNVLQAINDQRAQYQNWEANIENSLCGEGSKNNKNKNFVILEFGCGLNVPAVRIESEEVLHDCLHKINNNNSTNNNESSSSSSSSSVTLIRINPKDAGIENNNNIDLQRHTISIYDTSLNALRAIDKMLLQLQKSTTS